MKKILTASSNPEVIKTIENACKRYSAYFYSSVFSDTDAIINNIDYEMPEIKVLDFTSKQIDTPKILSIIDEDPWLHYGGIICVCKSEDQVCEIEQSKNSNILSALTVKNFTKHFSRILRILWQNQRFLFNRGMQDLIGGQESGEFICGNDPLDLRFYTNFLVSYLYNTNRIDEENRFNLQMSLMELLTNALEHGNLEISFEEKTEWMQKGGDIIELIERRSNDPKYAERRIKISYIIGKSRSRFIIRDDGKGFDWRKFTNINEPTIALHGRGISLSTGLTDKLTYNDAGNEVSFEIENLKNTTNNIPGIMRSFDTLTYTDKQIVCRENEMSNDLFFIISGRFAVYSGRKLVSVITPNDLFIGEMAFLLNDRRSATVLAVGECKLIKIPKGDFLTLIRHNPHYGIFLSRMLAQRLLKQTQKTISLQQKYQ